MSLRIFKKSFFLFIFSFLVITNANSTIYYVSQSGNDNNNGTSPGSSWQTISKVNSMMASIVAGDQILFNKGDRFFGTLTITKSGTAGNEIIIGSYGSGSLPEITGKKIITGWTVYSGNIYKATLSTSDTVSNLYVNNAIMTKARFPNSGFLRTDYCGGNTGFYDAALTQPSGYWNNADCKIRTINWAYEIRKVSSFGSGSVNFSTPTVYSNYTDYGYYFDNKLELLDVQKEWYYDKATGTLYFYAPGGVNPNTLQIEAVIQRFGVNSNNNFIKVNDLKISGYSESAIQFYSGNNKSILGCYITQTGIYGINLNGNNHLIENNTFEDNLSTGIFGVTTGGSVRYNTFNRNGLIPGYGQSGAGYVSILANYFNKSVIEFNNIDSSGYNGIGIANTNLVKNNIIDYSCLILNDGGGIDVTDCDTLRIIDNMIFNTIGNFETSGVPNSYSCGIYINGALMKNSTIQGNTVCYSRYMGILVDHKNTPVNNKIIGNICYNNFSAQMLLTDYSAAVFIPAYNTVIKKNILYSLSAEQSCLHLRGHTSSGISDFGTFDSNYYCNPYSNYLVRRTNFLPSYISNIITLDSWKSTYGKDLNSKSLPFSLDQYGITDTLSGNLLSNSIFNTNISPWISWPSGASVSWINNPNLDSGSLKMKWNGSGYSLGLALSNRYAISAGNYYQIGISTVGNHSGTFSLWGFSSLSSTTFSFPQTFFSYNNVRNDYSFVYKSDITDPQAYMSIGLALPDTVAYFDNVTMYRVNVEKLDSSQMSKVFLNTSSTPSSVSLNGIAYKDLDGNPVNGSIILQPYSSRILVNEGFIPSRKLNLKVMIEGLYNPITDKMISDTATIFIRNATAPYTIIDSARIVLDSSGNGSYNSYTAINSTNYYLSLRHRNSIETWSGTTVTFNNNTLTYDFTTSANKAHGNNLILSGSRYCIYSGDVVNDGQIELVDVLQVFNVANFFTTGFLNEDLNGDEVIDLSDIQIVYNNSAAFVRTSRP